MAHSSQEKSGEHSTQTDSWSLFYGEDLYEHVTPGLVYIDTSCPGKGVDEELFSSLPQGCDCVGFCKDLSSCFCLAQSKRAAQSYSAFECNSGCRCAASCPNRVTQRGPRKGLKVVHLGDKGWGVVTEKDIPKGAFVCEYAGEIIGHAEALRRLRIRQASADTNYILVIREHVAAMADDPRRVQTTVIDPTVLGNVGRYLNHSCEPNLYLAPVRIDCLVPIAALFTTKPVYAGEELCYNYHTVATFTPGDQRRDGTSVQPLPKACLCGARSCRGFLPSDSSLF